MSHFDNFLLSLSNNYYLYVYYQNRIISVFNMNSYSNLKVSNDESYTSNGCQKKTLYFSDGTLEVDEIDGDSPAELDSKSDPVNPQELTWFPWMWYQTSTVGSKALEVCDYLGESLASFFGITTPKYQFELNEYYRIKKEEEEAQCDIEMGDWVKKGDADDTDFKTVSTGPKSLCVNNSNNISNG